MWNNPIPSYKLYPTNDSDSYKQYQIGETGIPQYPHVGSYNIKRKFDLHLGIDLYCDENTQVVAVESGTIVDVGIFTGIEVNTPWWLETWFIVVRGSTGLVLYGELQKPIIKINDHIIAGQPIGKVTRVLIKDKGRPTTMLHLELSVNGTTVDPTPFLLSCEQ